jgi:hypothetical protein
MGLDAEACVGRDGRTFDHIRFADAAPLRPVVHNALLLPHELVQDDGAVEIDQTDAREGRFRAIDSYAHHLTIKRQIFSGTKEYPLEPKQILEAGGRTHVTHSSCWGVYSTWPRTICCSAAMDSPFL